MSKYLVIVPFTDLQDNDFQYRVGDEYPRSGLEVSNERLEELSTKNNRRGIQIIAPVEATEKPEEVPLEEETGEKPSNTTEAPEEAKETPRKGRRKKNAD